MGFLSRVHGHLWTVYPRFRHDLLGAAPPPSRHWTTTGRDPEVGEFRLSGRYHAGRQDELLIVVHGLGGSHRSSYAIDAALAAERAGISCLRLNLRGADRKGRDFYHAGLTADLRAVFASDLVRAHRTVYLLGYSLGGHVTLRFVEDPPPSLCAAATICAPLDLEAGANEIDQPKGRVYRRHVLRGLKEIYRGVAAKRAVMVPTEDADGIDTIRGWDETIIAPRFGFASAEEYWRTQSAGPRLANVNVPTLMVIARRDPMVFFQTLERFLPAASPIDARILDRGGHVGFPPGVDLGDGASGGIEDQVLHWLRRRLRER